MAGWLTISQLIQNLALTLAVIVGGGWTFYQFVIRRGFETGLEMDISSHPSRVGSMYVVFIEVIMKNTGNRDVRAKAKRLRNGKRVPVYKDELVILYESCGLQLRRIELPGHEMPSTQLIHWNSVLLAKLRAIPDEVDLLREYWTNDRGATDFYIVPGELAHLSATLLLEPGQYLGRVIFVGGNKGEYWSQTHQFSLPSTSE